MIDVDAIATINRPRRYYLLYRQFFSNILGDTTTAGAIRTKQEAQPGRALPSDFPFLAKISAPSAGYTTIEDLDGANVRELRNIGLTQAQAIAVLTRLQKLLP
jgi:hypothetical protein